MDWILASASPRRKELFAELVEKFEILPAKGEEKIEAGLTPVQLVKALATQKAEEVAALPIAEGKFVLGADTVVALGNEVLGKPKGRLHGRMYRVRRRNGCAKDESGRSADGSRV